MHVRDSMREFCIFLTCAREYLQRSSWCVYTWMYVNVCMSKRTRASVCACVCVCVCVRACECVSVCVSACVRVCGEVGGWVVVYVFVVGCVVVNV